MKDNLLDDFNYFVDFCFEHGGALKNHKEFLSMSTELSLRIERMQLNTKSSQEKQKEKQRRKELLDKIDREKRFPDDCFCENKLYLESEIIETKTETWYRGLTGEEVPQKINFYRCSQCGKKYDDEPIIAYA